MKNHGSFPDSNRLRNKREATINIKKLPAPEQVYEFQLPHKVAGIG